MKRRSLGAIPHAVTRADKREAVRRVGAEDVIARDGDLVGAVARATGGEPIDVVATQRSGFPGGAMGCTPDWSRSKIVAK